MKVSTRAAMKNWMKKNGENDWMRMRHRRRRAIQTLELETDGVRIWSTVHYLHNYEGERQRHQDGEFIQHERREHVETCRKHRNVVESLCKNTTRIYHQDRAGSDQ